MKLRPVKPDVDFPALEERVLEHWDAVDAFRRSVEERSSAEPYTFYDGPPFATGLPHYGHFVASVLKDIVPRYWTMLGRRVERRWGWDCHGLPVENEAQKELGITTTAEIDALGVAGFNEVCRGLVLRYTAEWRRTIRRLGRWVDHDHGYRTMDTDFMESVWWAFAELWNKGLIYEGFRVQPVSPKLGTPLSNFEVALGPQERDPVTKKEGHKRRQDPSITVRFALEDEAASVWAWTTTPWTLPSNLALAVNPTVEYVKVRIAESSEIVYVEPARLADYQTRKRVGAVTELGRVLGAALVGRPYRPLLPYFAHLATDAAGVRKAFKIVGASYVGADSGTGVVHQAPAFGEDDFQVGMAEGLPLVNPVTLAGNFTGLVPDFAGQYVKDADRGITAKLKAEGKLVDQDTIVHAVPHCYRTEAPLLYMAVPNWFMRVESMRAALVESNAGIRWVPREVGEGRFGNWLEGARDWNLSRSRYWGTPLPIWRCEEDPSDMECFGSRQALAERAGVTLDRIADLHRDHVDDITFPSQRTPDGTMRRVREVFDCWFESGSMPFAQHHYPFENRALVDAAFPADFIAEGLDQTRGWFYTLTVLATALRGGPAFRNVIVNGIVLAEDGEKMSKMKRNFPDPNLVLQKYGADALRLYLVDSPVVNARDLRFSEAGVQEKVRAVLLPLWNAYSFLTRYAEVDGWEPDGVAPDPRVNELDGWVLSRLQTLVARVRERMAAYELFRVVPDLLGFIDELTNWYIRLSRRRFWRGTAGGQGVAGNDDADKSNAYRTLHHVLEALARVLAPFLPFVSEELYSNLTGGTRKDSVHLDEYPTPNPALVDAALEERMALARTAVGLVRGLRAKHNVRGRQPLQRMTVVAADEASRTALLGARELIADEINVKEVVVSGDETEFVSYSARPNLPVLGKRYGKQLGAIKAEVLELSSGALARIVQGEAVPSQQIAGLVYDASTLIVDRASRPGTVVDTLGGVTVALDLEVTDALRLEGLAREFVSRVQALRKERDFALDTRIQVDVQCEGMLARAISKHWDLIAGEVLAVGAAPDLGAGSQGERHPGDGLRLEIEGEVALVRINRAASDVTW